MKIHNRSFITAAFGIGFCLSAQASSIYTGIHVFGDSLSDSGNVFAATGGTQPDNPLGYRQGFGNGPPWVEKLATDYLDLPPISPSLAGGTNHAWGGAWTDGGGSVPTVLGQINGFIGAGGSFASTDLVTIWAGANDFFSGVTDPSIPVGNLADAIRLAADNGAENFLVPNLPNLGETPAFLALGDPAAAGMTFLTNAFNDLLAIALEDQRTALDIQIFELDIDGIFDRILSDPAALGFTNTQVPVLVTGDIANADQYLFWDGVHPTDPVHDIFAADAAQALGIPEPSSTLLVLSASLLILGRRRR